MVRVGPKDLAFCASPLIGGASENVFKWRHADVGFDWLIGCPYFYLYCCYWWASVSGVQSDLHWVSCHVSMRWEVFQSTYAASWVAQSKSGEISHWRSWLRSAYHARHHCRYVVSLDPLYFYTSWLCKNGSWLHTSGSNTVRLKFPFSALVLLVGQQEGCLACKSFAPEPLSHGSWY